MVHVGQGTHLGGLSLFPVWSEGPVVSGLRMGLDADVTSDEREGSPVVGELVLGNTGDKPALLVAGELFEGGWQHRALNHDVLLAPGQRLVASVSCVEQGRWQGHASQVRRARNASLSVRAAQATSARGERQHRVWERVSRYDRAFGASPTGSYVDHLDGRTRRRAQARSRSEHLVTAVRAVRPLSGQRGVLVGLGGQPAFLEVFASQSGLRRQLTALLEACALDAAMVRPEPTPGRRVRRFLGGLAGTSMAADSAVEAGAGRALTARTERHAVSGLGWQDRLLHATVFNRQHELVAG